MITIIKIQVRLKENLIILDFECIIFFWHTIVCCFLFYFIYFSSSLYRRTLTSLWRMQETNWWWQLLLPSGVHQAEWLYSFKVGFLQLKPKCLNISPLDFFWIDFEWLKGSIGFTSASPYHKMAIINTRQVFYSYSVMA